ncbi:DUF2332 domain-containing protein [Novosphingobium mathurense]|uniref:DUF2332 domain-containing protein n=1 Tax=Novosphingobium mathurense TaxID=428990 RepID=A0A1U6H233_9SPHN|nr:DUF2332 domain-containing protein [Novosphingobium mathurense]SLJ89815.1 hypothetical protein SAMN06295987_1011075 [Novosphingobium mathurense]
MEGENGAIMDIADVERAIRWQAEHCMRNGAPCTGRLLLGFLALLGTDLAVAGRMREWEGLSLEDAMPLRLAGGFHNLHLTGAEMRLGPVYRGETTVQGEVDAIVLAVAQDHDAQLLPWFDGPPQTNEAGRSAGVMGALLWLSDRIGPRFALMELGSSAGINTMLDRFSFDLGGVRVGGRTSPMHIAPEWRGAMPPQADVEITSIRGCDIAPIDLTDPVQALRLKSYVWAEMHERLERIDAAQALAVERKPSVERADAADFVTRMLAAPQDAGVARVLFHTIVWQYLPPVSRTLIEQVMERAGKEASAERPLAWIRVETNRRTFRHEIRVRHWPGGGEEALLGEVHAHGAWVEWFPA